ncbi:uncharacterized protein LOC117338121 [Pecten maximus]|uniref:uncharacterized protein LOC117338121 n=1 Tax=Pecten maximus TaxID=6579 RepID=UPI0014584DA9|nr:uncharacterized protein LOC117338121 [Pecten maximus]XP_033755220.1 uncharacterized protein LOC117338121 [Pecten maximus]
MKMTKSDWRSKMSDYNLSDQLMITLESSDISTFDPMPAISLWMSGATRRLRQEKETSSAVTSAVAENPKEPEVVDIPTSTSTFKSAVTSAVAENPKEPEVVDIPTSISAFKLPDVQLTHVPTTASRATMTDIIPVPQMSTTGTMAEPISKAVPVAEYDEAYMSDDDYNDEAKEHLEKDVTLLKDRLHSASNAWQNFCDLWDIRVY